jgi:hypothetical protein
MPLVLLSRPLPSSGRVTFALSGRASAPGELSVFDAAGRRVLHRIVPADQREVVWDGRTDGGHAAGAGVYFARFVEGARTAETKVVRLGP